MAVDFAPAGRLLLLAGSLASLPLAWWWLRYRKAQVRERMAALTALVLFLTFDLIVFGAFTRLTDSGLGCPDWPGCYGAASPVGAGAPIAAAQAAVPDGPVTWSKAWIEMIHRYLAMTVGALILAMTLVAWRARPALSLRWALVTLAWVIVQGLFGKYTVTLKLQPAVVTAHLLGGMLLLALLIVQRERLTAPRPAFAVDEPYLRRVAAVVLALVAMQVALGGWVSTNYAVLACRGFPTCNGQWWPPMSFEHAFDLWRDLGRTGDGGFLPAPALVAIHMVHRLFAWVATAAVLVLSALLWRGALPAGRRLAMALLAVLALQIASGLSNVVLDWPLVAALLHSGGAACLVGLLTMATVRQGRGS